MARVFTDLHHNASRPTLSGDDIFIDDVSGNLNSNLSSLAGWSSVPANIRQGWSTRSSQTSFNSDLVFSPTNGIISVGVTSLDSSTAVAVGYTFSGNNSRIFRSTDSGASWTEVFSPTNGIQLFGVTSLDSSTAVAVGYTASGNNSRIFRSTDSGASWTEVFNPTDGIRLFGVTSLDSSTAVAVGHTINSGVNSRIFRSTDSGASWTEVFSPTNGGIRLFGVTSLDSSTAVAVGYASSGNNSRIFRSTDSGASWTEVFNPTDGIRLFGVTSLDSSTAVAVGYTASGNNSRIFRSTDSGASWTEVFNPTDGIQLRGVTSLDSSTAVAVGYTTSGINSRIFKSTDSGASWTEVFNPTDGIQLRGVTSLDSSTAVAVGYTTSGNNSRIFRSTDVLKTGQDNPKRIGWFYVDYDGANYSVLTYDGSNLDAVEVDVLNFEGQTGTQTWIKWFPFTDANGFPTSINYDLGGGAQNYCGWGIEYTNEDTNGYLQNQRLVLIRDFTYPASPADAGTTTVDELLSLTSVNVNPDDYSAVVISKGADLAFNQVYNKNPDNSINYTSQVTSELTALTQAVLDTIFTETWCEGGILGLGGTGSTDGNGAIDNIRLLTLNS